MRHFESEHDAGLDSGHCEHCGKYKIEHGEDGICLATTSFTKPQRKLVEALIMQMANQCGRAINANAPDIQALDERPRETYTDEKPDVFFPYVAQAILEGIIEELQSRV